MGNCLIRRRIDYEIPPYSGSVTWANGTDAEIADVLSRAYNGEFDLSQSSGWAIGSERTVNISAIPAGQNSSSFFNEPHSAQQITLVLMDTDRFDLTTPIGNNTKCKFVVGMKNCLEECGDLIKDVETNSNWNDMSDRRNWIDNYFMPAIPSTFRGIFKSHKVKVFDALSGMQYQFNNYFSIPTIGQITGKCEVTVPDGTGNNMYEVGDGGSVYQTTGEFAQLEYYAKNQSNMVKKLGDSGSEAISYYSRSNFATQETQSAFFRADGHVSKTVFDRNYYGEAGYASILSVGLTFYGVI